MKILKNNLVHRVAEYCQNFKYEFEALTPREKEIINLWLNGKKSVGIAENLGIQKSTVLTHKKNILKKTNLKSPKDAVLFALAFNLI
jgi:DNA-binding CsgD family transcriptional regulator